MADAVIFFGALFGALLDFNLVEETMSTIGHANLVKEFDQIGSGTVWVIFVPRGMAHKNKIKKHVSCQVTMAQ